MAAVRTALAGDAIARRTATAVRYLLQVLAERRRGQHGRGARAAVRRVQAIEGPRHTRGTPPNVVEMDAATWLALATGTLPGPMRSRSARLIASGSRADLTAYLPLQWDAS